METVSQILIRYAETDLMGLVHHSVYPVYFEQGRTDFFKEHLLPYQDFEKAGLLAPVLKYQVEISSALTYGDSLYLRTFPTYFRGLRCRMGYEGYLGENPKTLVVQGESEHALVGLDRRPIHPRRFPQVYQLMKERFEEALAPT